MAAIEAEDAPKAGFQNVVRVLRIRNYRMYTAGNAISLIGSWMQRASVLWLAWALAHSTVWLGIISVADLAPTLVLSPLAGLLADRVDRVRLIRATQIVAMAQAVVLAALTYAGLITVELLFLLTLLLGAVAAVNQPARLALVSALVDRANLGSAIAVNSLVFNGARFLGPAAAGIVIERSSIALAFAINAATYLPFIAALARLDLAEGGARAPAPWRFFGDTAAGYAYALRHPGIGRMFLLFAVTCFALRGFVEMFPAFADEVFGRGVEGYTWLTATLGLGALLGGLFMVRRPGVHGLTALIIGHTCVVAVSALGFTATSSYWVAVVCVFVCGFSLVTTGISAQTLIQTAVDPAMRGRVLAVYGMLFRGGPAVSALALGWLASFIGLRLAVVAGASLCLLYWAWARLRQEAMERALDIEARGAAR